VATTLVVAELVHIATAHREQVAQAVVEQDHTVMLVVDTQLQ
jgi:hypothetical protein